MATSRPTFDNKVDRVEQPYARINKVIADDMNQLKAAIIALYDMFETVQVRTCIALTPAMFTGPYYQNSKLINLTPDVDFRLFTNDGSGTLLSWDEEGYGDGGYIFTPETGRISGVDVSGNYSLEIYTPVTEL